MNTKTELTTTGPAFGTERFSHRAGRVRLMKCGTMVMYTQELKTEDGFYFLLQDVQRTGGVKCKVCDSIGAKEIIPHIHLE